MAASWQELLDAMERDLAGWRALIEQPVEGRLLGEAGPIALPAGSAGPGSPDALLARFEPPHEDPGPIPADLLERAQSVLIATRELERQAVVLADALGQAVAAMEERVGSFGPGPGGTGSAASPAPRFVDRRA